MNSFATSLAIKLLPVPVGPTNRKAAIGFLGSRSPKIFLCTPIKAFKPSWNISEETIVNNIIPIQQEVANEYKLQVIDLHTLFGDDESLVLEDGIHPNGKGAQKMAQIISEAIKKSSNK